MKLDLQSIGVILKEINSESELERRKAELDSHRIFEGELFNYVESKLKKMYPNTWDLYNLCDYNLHKKINEKKSKSYVKPPQRKLDKQEETEHYTSILEEANFNDTMKVMDLYKNRHRYCGVGVIRERHVVNEVSKDKYNFWALAPYEFCVHRDQNGNIYAWSIPTGEDGDFDIWTLWTDESHVKIKTKDYKDFSLVEIPGNPGYVNPYGILPFVYVPMDCSGAYPYTSSLPRQTIEMNTNLSVYLTSGNMQIGQLVLKYPMKNKIEYVTHGLMTAINLPQSEKEGSPKTEADYISPSPNLEGHKDSILTFMMMILDEHGMNSNTSIKGGEKFTSGFDRLIANADVQDIIEDNQDAYTRVENSIYNIIKQMNLRDGSFTFLSQKLKVVFAKPKILTSDSEKLDNLKKKKDLGLWEDWELIMESDPNLSEEEAKAKAERLKPSRVIEQPETQEDLNGNNQDRSVDGTTAEAS